MLPLCLTTGAAFELIGTFQEISGTLYGSCFDLLRRMRMRRQIKKYVAWDYFVISPFLPNGYKLAVERNVASLRVLARIDISKR